jgi:hypothetical protein
MSPKKVDRSERLKLVSKGKLRYLAFTPEMKRIGSIVSKKLG